MSPEQARKLLESFEGAEVIVISKPAVGGGMAGFNATGALKKFIPDGPGLVAPVDGLWEVSGYTLDPTKPPQQAGMRMSRTIFSEETVGAVIVLGELSSVAPAAIARPGQGGGLFR